MGATNHTTNYNLSQFIGTDKPSWLNDYNGDMSSIDTAIKSAADAASLAQTTATNADTTATSASNTASALATQINTPVTGIAAVVSTHTSDISNITTEIGNTPLTTLAQTLTGAIEEVKGSIPSVSGVLTLKNTVTIEQTYDGATTHKQAMDAVYTDLVAAFAALQSNEYIKIIDASYNNQAYPSQVPMQGTGLLQTVPTFTEFFNIGIGTNAANIRKSTFSSNSNIRVLDYASNTWSVQDLSANNGTSGAKAFITYQIYEISA